MAFERAPARVKGIMGFAEVQAIYAYDPETGQIRWACDGRNRKKGVLVGSVNVAGYLTVLLLGSKVYAHQVAWLLSEGVWPEWPIDHINGVKADNRRANLREVTKRGNAQNIRKAHRDNATGVLGVTLRKDTGRYTTRILAEGGYVSLGCFDTADEAGAAYLAAKRQLHDGFAP